MKLIGNLTSPYVRKVRIVLAEKKIDYDLEIDSPWAADTKVSRSNPLGKVPVLVLDDNTSLFDSRVITEYLDGVTPNNRLIPSPNRERSQVKRWEALGDGVCDAAVLTFLEAKRSEAQRSEPWVARQKGKITLALEFMAEDLGDQAWCHGSSFSLADISTGVALGYLALRCADIDWRSGHPNLGRLYDKLMQRPSFADTVPQE